ncbi:aldose epimerase [Corynebacterium diphtheriae]|nr:aldose epimerase [Corynebacterium diphtheriae]
MVGRSDCGRAARAVGAILTRMSTVVDMPETRGHLISAITTASDPGEILYLSSRADFSEGGSIRGGVPIIAPWFAKNLGHDELQHGWARRVEWETIPTNGGIDARTSHDDWDLRLGTQVLPHGFAMMLKARNASPLRRDFQSAFHPYFRVADVRTTTVTVGDQEFRFDGTAVDQAVPLPEWTPLVIKDSQRTITVTYQGADHAVVWNPGSELAAQMTDVGEGEWTEFVCVEPALLGDQAQGVSVPPWDWVEIGMTVKVTPAQ